MTEAAENLAHKDEEDEVELLVWFWGVILVHRRRGGMHVAPVGDIMIGNTIVSIHAKNKIG